MVYSPPFFLLPSGPARNENCATTREKSKKTSLLQKEPFLVAERILGAETYGAIYTNAFFLLSSPFQDLRDQTCGYLPIVHCLSAGQLGMCTGFCKSHTLNKGNEKASRIS